MQLFCKPYLIKNSNNPLEEILKELSLFKQTLYCYEYIKTRIRGKSDEELKEYAEIAASAFRQAFEFYNSAKNNYITTSPLLYSYSLNNFAKGLIYLYNPQLNHFFNRHGFAVEDKKISDSLLDTLISVNKQGPGTAILKLLGNHVVEKQDISFRELLEHIPEISDIYTKSTHMSSSTALLDNNGNYNLKSDNWELDIKRKKELFSYFKLQGTYIGRTKSFSFFTTMASQDILRDTNSYQNFYYKDNVILPIKLNEGIYSINIMYYSYLIIMSYGMLVRYNANRWEKYIDPKMSNESIIIEESIIECVKIFITHVHIILFEYTFEDIKYNDHKVKEVINNSTEDIMKNIQNEIKWEARRTGKTAYLPW